MRENAAEMVNASGRPFGELIREYRRRNHLSQEQLGALVGIKKNAVGAWEAGRSRPDVASIPVLCKALGIPLHVFFGMAEDLDTFRLNERFSRLTPYNRQVVLRQMDTLYELQSREEVRSLRPLVRLFQSELSAAAGPLSYIEEARGELVYLAADEVTSKADEIIRVSGDSMEPSFEDGDQVLVQHVDRVQEGEIGIFVNGDAGYIKEYHRDGLYSHNPQYAPIRFSESDSVRCVGRVLGKLLPDQRATMEEIAAFGGSRL
ncbi:MAG: LexA family transcriptional regulator [Clostridia bacterium]|nr:LexA family transcriptional regulator [Clostridia bacterium]